MYIFFLPEIDGYPLEGPDSLPIRMLPEETQQKFEQIQWADLQACMKQLLQRPDVISAQTFGFGTPSDDSFHGDASPVVPEERFSVNVMISFTKLYLSFKLY